MLLLAATIFNIVSCYLNRDSLVATAFFAAVFLLRKQRHQQAELSATTRKEIFISVVAGGSIVPAATPVIHTSTGSDTSAILLGDKDASLPWQYPESAVSKEGTQGTGNPYQVILTSCSDRAGPSGQDRHQHPLTNNNDSDCYQGLPLLLPLRGVTIILEWPCIIMHMIRYDHLTVI